MKLMLFLQVLPVILSLAVLAAHPGPLPGRGSGKSSCLLTNQAVLRVTADLR
jgi:hypothetical protein